MPSYCPPAEKQRISLVDTLERTASSSSSKFFEREAEREAERAFRSRATSQYHTSRIRNYGWIRSLKSLEALTNNWNTYGSPAPNAQAIEMASSVLDLLAISGVSPEAVNASAEGGVAIIFTGANRNRAIIESLNNSELYILLYDLDGHSRTVDLPIPLSNNFSASELLLHLEGIPLAA